MTIGFTDLFTVLGKAFAAQGIANTARGTTVPTAVDGLVSEFNALDPSAELAAVSIGLPSGLSGFQSAASGLQTTLQQFARDFLIFQVNADNQQPDNSLNTALVELIRQMLANSESVDASTIGVSVTPGGSNVGDGVIVTSTKRSDGLTQQNSYAETLNVAVSSDVAPGSLLITDSVSASALDFTWPEGSGASSTVQVVNSDTSILSNGGFEDESDVDNAPDDWFFSVGTIGTTVKMTNVEIQTVIMSGTPTAGNYRLYWTYRGKVYQTGILAYNASGSDVQSALRALPGLALITVVTTGSTPNFTHTITFTGAGGNVTQLTSQNNTDSGSIAHATSSGGTAQVYRGGKAMEWDSDGSQLICMQQVVDLQASTAYAVNLWAITDSVPAAGVITIDLVDGIGGSVIQDAQGTNNSFTFSATDLTTSWQSLQDLVSGETVFRTPETLPTVVYFRMRVTTAISNTSSVWFDELCLTRMATIYTGGPMVAAFGGTVEFVLADTWTIAVTNNRAGLFQEYFNRNFGMADLGLLLPYDTGGTETIDDALIA